MDAQTETVAPAAVETDGFEWMLIEIFGHRMHWGRGMEVERFGAKMLRIDVPQVKWSEPTAEAPTPEPQVAGWVTHFYGGSAIFSQTLTDERTAMLRNAPYAKPSRYLAAPQDSDDEAEVGSPEPITEYDDDGRPF